MKARCAVPAVLMLVASSMRAQDLQSPKCPGGAPLSSAQVAQDACQQAYDVYQLVSPQLGLALTGGNATAGQGGVLGGVGRFSIGLRVNGFSGLLPDVSNSAFTPRTGGASPARTLPTTNHLVGLPTADGAVGLFRGFPVSLTNVLGLDALLSVSYLPEFSNSSISVSPRQNWQFGYGARLGLLSESIITPGVSVTWIERDLPTTDITASVNNTQLQVLGEKVKTNAWRVVASKNLILFSVAVGGGRDHYDQSANVSGSISQGLFTGSATAPGTDQTLDRTNLFADLSYNLPFFKIVAEIGQASGGTVQTYNSFAGGRADRSQVYGSIGLRLTR
ncbi:MAG TPA: hypothetical protein VL524_13140 [Gemmatimonadaceae bacterium]|jgi:hypothetical protein|nr:hypothetical protein [Gemmatimonadaceae bacterium]